MRKPRDFDAELKALDEKTRELKARKVRELGELVIATGAGALAPEELAGALIVLAETTDPAKREAWAKRGAAMFRQRSGATRRRATATRQQRPGMTCGAGRSNAANARGI
jgi:DNA-binding protein H-NS